MNESMAIMKVPMKILMIILLLSGVLSMRPAVAGLFDSASFSAQYQGPGGAKGGYDRRQARDARNVQPYPQPQRERSRGHLTEDERRQLHRDLDKANRELYGGNRRRNAPAN